MAYSNLHSGSLSLGKSLFKGSEFLVDKSDGIGNDLAVSITGGTGVHIVLSSLFALVPAVSAFFSQDLDSLVGVIEGSLGLHDLVVNGSEFRFSVGEFSGCHGDGNVEEIASLLIGLDSLVLSETVEVEGFLDLEEEVVAKGDNASNSALVGKLFSTGGNGGKSLEELTPAFAVLELVGLADGGLEVLLDELDTLGGKAGIGVDLSALDKFSFRGLEVLGEEASALGDDGGSFVVLLNDNLKFFGFLSALGIKISQLRLQVCKFLGLGLYDGSDDLTTGVEFTFELGFKRDLLFVGFSKFLIKATNVGVACILESMMSLIVFLLFGDVSVLEVMEGGQKLVKRLACLKLQVDGVE
jgi:hypothetical protein